MTEVTATHPSGSPSFADLSRLKEHVRKHVFAEPERWEDLISLELIEDAEVEWFEQGQWGAACNTLSSEYQRLVGQLLLESCKTAAGHRHSVTTDSPSDSPTVSLIGLPDCVAFICADSYSVVSERPTVPYYLRTAYRPLSRLSTETGETLRRWADRKLRMDPRTIVLACSGVDEDKRSDE